MPNDDKLYLLFGVLVLLAGCSIYVIILKTLTRSTHWEFL